MPVVNRLITGLPRRERERVLDQAQRLDLSFGDVVCEAEEPYAHVYFPLTGLISLVLPIEGHPALELGLIGNEGMLGATLALGVRNAPVRAVVQGQGTALRVTATQFRRELRLSPVLLRRVNRFLYAFMAQLGQGTACARFHEVEPRLARWLLMTHDRAHADHFHLTHQYLADMLGVQRSAITIAAGALQARRLISYSRGEIRIIDRAGLEAMSCECYEAMAKDYEEQFA